MRLIYCFTTLISIVVLSLCTACREDLPEENLSQEEMLNNEVNSWIYENMDLYYFWNSSLPAEQESRENPSEYFYSLLNRPEDRFSVIYPNYSELLNSLNGQSLEAGYEFTLYEDSSRTNGVFGQIDYIKEGSPAEQTELLRGDLFSSINGTDLTVDNYRSLLGELGNNHSLEIKRYDRTRNSFTQIADIQFSVREIEENPILLDTVYSIGDKKVGYFIYTIFTPGTTGDTLQTYLKEMDAVFANFQSEGINHLIVDLRYNGGGAETATINLASLIGKGVDENSVFVRRKYNEDLERYILDEFGEDFLVRRFLNKDENIGDQLQSPSLTVLTSGQTASASELLINGLLPYMDVTIIGDRTVGKNMGSIALGDDENPDNDYGMLPLVTKSFNSANQSDYSTGFIPDVEAKDNDLVKFQLGDTNEKLLNLALQQIGISVNARLQASSPSLELGTPIKSSKQSKIGYGTLLLNDIK